MMYSNKVVVALKVNGKVLREHGDTVYIPFGSEYSIFIKNMHSQRCLVRIEIDGQDIGDGNGFVVNSFSTTEIERFLKNGNMNAGNRFKFIERTSKVEQHRGVGAEDGIICVTYEFEKPAPVYQPLRSPNTVYDSSPFRATKGTSTGDYVPREIWCSTASASCSVDQQVVTRSFSAQVNDAGITVGGSISEQKFQTVSFGKTDGMKHSIVLKLLGEVGQQKVKKALTVQSKQKCSICGHVNKSSAKFCVECGAGLLIPA